MGCQHYGLGTHCSAPEEGRPGSLAPSVEGTVSLKPSTLFPGLPGEPGLAWLVDTVCGSKPEDR